MKTKETPLAGGAGSDYLNALDGQYSKPPPHNCQNCGILTHWPLCPSCYRWRIHYNAVQQAMRAIRGRI